QVGMEGDIPIPGDYDGDGMDEFAVWRPQDHTFYVSLNNTDWAGNPVLIVKIDGAGEIPIKGNFDDDPADEMGVWRESDGVWTIALDNSTQTNDPNDYLIVQTGMQGDIPIAADYEGDGMDEIAVWRPVDGSYFINYHNVDWATCPLDECVAVRTDVPNGTPVPGQFERTY
ncbi:MAG TPA: hypothetical protein VHP83_17650, partial [Aggregatilineaceae bacterium]|nr:hypothetical protein [Aggregatilineaceae bacterium]